jgi:hypothetical protein
MKFQGRKRFELSRRDVIIAAGSSILGSAIASVRSRLNIQSAIREIVKSDHETVPEERSGLHYANYSSIARRIPQSRFDTSFTSLPGNV